MALRKLLLCFLVVCGLLAFYVLSVSLQIRVPWHMVEGLGRGDASTPGTVSWSHVGLDQSTSEPTDTWTTSGLTTATTSAVFRSFPPQAKSSRGPSDPPWKQPSPRTTGVQEPDFTGDVYAAEVAPLQTSCPDSIRIQVEHSSFSSSFLTTVPILQWAEHSSASEYERLRRYSGAYGWQGVPFSVVQASLSVLNTSASHQMFDDWAQRGDRSGCIRCAVVGNGGILRHSRKGAEIDQHDYVFRTNGAVFKGFEDDVGSRTTHYTFSTNTLRNSLRSYAGVGYTGPPVSPETRYLFLPDHDRDYILLRAAATHTPVESGPESSNSPPTYFGENANSEAFKMYHPDFIRYIRNRFLRSSALNTRYKNLYRPSTGAVMLMAALHACDQVSAYGFMTPDYQKYSDHYYDQRPHPVVFYINHDLRLEMNLWQDLHQAGLIHLYMRE
ncbi:alpha-N-acetylgalactosaminide alpha-2,6-sialyltransferase 2 [Denticeps clupeoides]|uniref:alpha-N-acetylgalactosaminide alpha-2,6-sialyltransferase n=1 Tax=Denticeps clupeoides TaxID=299321 RepID=A0AAY4CCA1_9TELE|nr:alpha-N-acetylgalactosaminide alpha-2,6-sialyltransferase 2-like [Denticeps clupeoides]XP_028824833.1 alpha-N-acetylgalactosaminide alpha-2,6-sialyltransferase 2-like [Denticeps clupeoides]